MVFVRKYGFMPKLLPLLLTLILVIVSAEISFPVQPRAQAEGTAQEMSIGDFETGNDGWFFFNGAEFPGANGAFEQDGTVAQSGAFSGKLTGDFTGGGAYVTAGKSFSPRDITELNFWVKTSDTGVLGLRLVDSTGQIHQQNLVLDPTSDWQKKTVTLFNGGNQYSHWGGANDGKWHSPAREVSFVMDRSRLKSGKLTGSVWIDNVVLKGSMPALEIEQVKLGNVFSDNEPASFRILTQGDTVVSRVYDYWNDQVAEQTDTVEKGLAMINIPELKHGYYTLKVTALQNGSPMKEAANAFAVLPPNDLSQVNDSPFGMSTHFGQTWSPELIPLLQKAGAKNIRDELYWNKIEKEKGAYSFPPAYDRFMSVLQANYIKPFTIFSYTNPNYDQNSTPYTDEGRKGFAGYGREILQHYAGQIEWAEVYNEFNIFFGDFGNGPADSKPDYYFKLLKETFETVKASNPNITVVGAATSGIPMDWLEELFKLGGLNYMDAISIHPYRYPAAPEGLAQDIVKLQDLIKRYNNGNTKPVWITEVGWPTQLDARGVSEVEQAQYIVRSHVVSLSEGVEKIFWYDFKNDGLTKTYNEHNFGIIRYDTDEKGKYSPKPAYVAYAVMTRQLTGAKFVQKEEIGDGIYSYIFNGRDGATRVVWSTKPNQVKVKTDVPITVTDLMGNEESFSPLHGYVYLTLTEDPVYIRGELQEISEGSKFILSGSQTPTGEPIPLILNADNTETPEGRITADFDIQGQTYAIDVMPHEKTEVQISLPGVDTTQTKTLYGYIRSNGLLVGKLMTEVSIIDPVQLQVKHVLKNDKDTVLVNVYNNLSREYKLDHIDWQIGSQTGVLNSDLTIPSRMGGSVDVPVPELPLNQTYPVTLTLHSLDAPTVVYQGNLRLVALSDMKPFAEKTITVDGTLDDLSGVPSIDLSTEGVVKMSNYGGAEDLSGKVWVTWDQDNLYVSAKIHDDVFSQTAVGNGIYQGDSIQFAVSQGMPGEAGEWYEYGIALTGSGPQVYRWIAANGLPTGLVNNARLNVVRDENAKDTIYELALPWSELKPVLPDDGLFSFSFLVNDNDGQGRKGYIAWGSGIGEGKSNKLFKPIRLVGNP
jgi:hypothetical protein